MSDQENPVREDGTQGTIDSELELETRESYHRREIAKGSLKAAVGIIVFPVVVSMFSSVVAARVDSISDIIVWGAAALISLAGAYMGLSSWAEVNKK